MPHNISIPCLSLPAGHGAGELLPDMIWRLNIHALPKIELHLNLDCCLSYEVMWRLARRLYVQFAAEVINRE